MIPFQAHMQIMAQQMESHFNGQGWDKPADFGVVIEVDTSAVDVPGAIVIGYAAASLPPELLRSLHRNPATALAMFGQIMWHEDAPDVVPPDVVKRVAGVYYVSEGWRAPVNLTDDDDPRSFADVPGATEVRSLHLLDCGGRYHFIVRTRGQEPQVMTLRPDRDVIEGEVAQGLRDLLLDLGRSGTEIDEKAVATIARENCNRHMHLQQRGPREAQ